MSIMWCSQRRIFGESLPESSTQNACGLVFLPDGLAAAHFKKMFATARVFRRPRLLPRSQNTDSHFLPTLPSFPFQESTPCVLPCVRHGQLSGCSGVAEFSNEQLPSTPHSATSDDPCENCLLTLPAEENPSMLISRYHSAPRIYSNVMLSSGEKPRKADPQVSG